MKLSIDHRASSRSAFTLVELAVVLGVIGLVLAAVWSAASTVFIRQKINDNQVELKTIADNIRATYSAAKTLPSSSTITTTLMTNGGTFPGNMISAGNSNPIDAEGGTVTIYMPPNSPGLKNAPGTVQQFEILFAGTPKTCQAVLAYFAGTASDFGIPYLSVDGSTWLSTTGNTLDATSFSGCTSIAATFNLIAQ